MVNKGVCCGVGSITDLHGCPSLLATAVPPAISMGDQVDVTNDNIGCFLVNKEKQRTQVITRAIIQNKSFFNMECKVALGVGIFFVNEISLRVGILVNNNT